MAGELRKLPGVAKVPAIPNEDADTGIIQVVPTTAPDSEETKELVARIRALPHFEDEYDIETAVTGYTAVQVDISDRLTARCCRSACWLWAYRATADNGVPVGGCASRPPSAISSASGPFGVTAAVFEWGWFASCST